MAHGNIRKIVHVAAVPDCHGPSPDSSAHAEGYGIIRGQDGKEVFFLDSAVTECEFRDLRTGQEVCFTLDSGPLRRAASVTMLADVDVKTNCRCALRPNWSVE